MKLTTLNKRTTGSTWTRLIVMSICALAGNASLSSAAEKPSAYNPGPMIEVLFYHAKDRAYQCSVALELPQSDSVDVYSAAHDCYAGGGAPTKAQVLLDIDRLPVITEVRNVFYYVTAPGERSGSFRAELANAQTNLVTGPETRVELTFEIENMTFIIDRFVRGDRFELNIHLELWNRDGFVRFLPVHVPIVLL